jgi:serine protease Do
MSGGPLFNRDGEVVGVNTVLVARRTGAATPISFAIPIDGAMRVVAELRIHGRVPRGALGWVIEAVPASAGARVKSVSPGAPAERAGIGAGDVILRIAGEEIRSPQEAARIVSSLKPGSRVPLELRRRGSTQAETVEVAVADAGD